MLGQLDTIFQGGTLVAVLMAFGYWIKNRADMARAVNEGKVQDNQAASDIRDEYALRYKETRNEVHGLRNELTALQGELRKSDVQSIRRGDKLNMVLFILRMVMDELSAQDSKNKILAQARKLLDRVEDEPHEPGQSNALAAAEETVEQAKETVREVKATEAKQ